MFPARETSFFSEVAETVISVRKNVLKVISRLGIAGGIYHALIPQPTLMSSAVRTNNESLNRYVAAETVSYLCNTRWLLNTGHRYSHRL